MKHHLASVYAVAISPDGKYAASAGEDRKVILWDLGSGKVVKSMSGHADVVHSLSFSRDGALLASGSADHTVRIWNVKTGEEEMLKTFPTKRTPVFNVQFTRRNLLLGCGPFQP
jgi:transcription initiation factor TFIID subunit 5